MQDLVDLGFGYDDTDSFIDNSEAVSRNAVEFDYNHMLKHMGSVHTSCFQTESEPVPTPVTLGTKACARHV